MDLDQAHHFVRSDLVQTVCKSYQQMTLGEKEYLHIQSKKDSSFFMFVIIK